MAERDQRKRRREVLLQNVVFSLTKLSRELRIQSEGSGGCEGKESLSSAQGSQSTTDTMRKCHRINAVFRQIEFCTRNSHAQIPPQLSAIRTPAEH